MSTGVCIGVRTGVRTGVCTGICNEVCTGVFIVLVNVKGIGLVYDLCNYVMRT